MKAQIIGWDELTNTPSVGLRKGKLSILGAEFDSILPPNPFPKSNVALMGGNRISKTFYINYEFSTLGNFDQINPHRFARKGKITEADAFIGIKERHPDVCYNEKFKQVLLKCRSQK